MGVYTAGPILHVRRIALYSVLVCHRTINTVTHASQPPSGNRGSKLIRVGAQKRSASCYAPDASTKHDTTFSVTSMSNVQVSEGLLECVHVVLLFVFYACVHRTNVHMTGVCTFVAFRYKIPHTDDEMDLSRSQMSWQICVQVWTRTYQYRYVCDELLVRVKVRSNGRCSEIRIRDMCCLFIHCYGLR